MSVTDVSAQNVAHAVLIALEAVEAATMPSGTSSRLFVAIRAADATKAYLAYEGHACPARDAARRTLLVRLDDVEAVESVGVTLRNLPVGSLMQRGISLAAHVAKAALADADPFAEHALHEAQLLMRVAQQIEEVA